MRRQELMMILFSFSTFTTSVMQLGEHEWLMYLSITDGGRGYATAHRRTSTDHRELHVDRVTRF